MNGAKGKFMRVLHLLKSNKYSGAENVVLTIMDICSDMEMIYVSPEGPIHEIVEKRGHLFYPLEEVSIKAVKKTIKIFKPDIIHAHDCSMTSIAVWAAGEIPVVSHLHNNPPWLKTICPKSLVLAMSLPKVRQIISVSSAVEAEYIFNRLMKKKNTIIGNVVDSESVYRSAQESCDCKQVDLIFLGRMTQQKCPLLFCQIVEAVKKSIPQLTVYMIGDGELMPQVKDYIYKHKLENTIKIIGFQSNPYPYLNAGKIMVMPSSFEGFGLAAVEGLCLRKPVVCSGKGGLVDIVNDSCGAICQTIEEYTDVIVQLLKDKELYMEKSKNAYITGMKYCDLSLYKDEILKVYEKAI